MKLAGMLEYWNTGILEYWVKNRNRSIHKFKLRYNPIKNALYIHVNDEAVPRDIDPEVNWLTNSYVYDIDDLKGVIDENIEDRQREAIKGERIIDEAVIRFREWYESLEVVPTIIALRNKLESIADAEVKKTLENNQIPRQGADAIQKMTHAIINKVLHGPIIFLKKDGMRDDKSLYIDVVRKLFNLDE